MDRADIAALLQKHMAGEHDQKSHGKWAGSGWKESSGKWSNPLWWKLEEFRRRKILDDIGDFLEANADRWFNGYGSEDNPSPVGDDSRLPNIPEFDPVEDLRIEEIRRRLHKHTPGGQSHDQDRHGDWASGSASSPSSTAGSSQSPADSSTQQPAAEVAAPSQAPQTQTPDAARNQMPLGPPANVQAPPGEPPDLVQRTIEEGLTKHGARIDYVMKNAGMVQMSLTKERAEAGLPPRGDDTMGMYGVWDGDQFQRWSPEREQLHSEIIRAEMERQRIENDGRLPKQEKQAIVMAGLPGSGKTFLLKNYLSSEFDLRDYQIINADDLKGHIVEMDSVQDTSPDQDLAPTEMASLVHEESSYLAKKWRAELMAQGTNIALDITAANKDKTIRDITRLREAGYTVHIVHADVEVDEALASALVRSGEGSPEPGKLGRIVPPNFIRSLQDTAAGTDKISVAFPDYAEVANGAVYWYRNYPLTGRSQGHKPELVWSRQPVLFTEANQPQQETAA